MATVSDSSLRELMDVVEAGRTSHPPATGLPTELLARAKALVPCDSVAYNEFESAERHHLVLQSVPDDDAGAPGADDEELAFWEHYADCLPCSYAERSGDLRTITSVSDFYSVREFHATGMYADYFGPLGIENEIMVSLTAPPGTSRRLIFFRSSGPDFDERERLLLALLRPHLEELRRSIEVQLLPSVALTQRQWELLRLVARGHSNSEIAAMLFLSAGTVRKHLENIFERLGVSSRTAAVAAAFPGIADESSRGATY